MTQGQPSRNNLCPCGSGKKYKRCCWGKGFSWVEDEQGQIGRAIPLSAEEFALLEQQRQRLRQHLGREPGPDVRLFFDAPPLEQVEHQITEALKRGGIDPALIYAFEQTGLLVTEDNQHLIAEHDLQAWYNAVAQYRQRHSSPQ